MFSGWHFCLFFLWKWIISRFSLLQLPKLLLCWLSLPGLPNSDEGCYDIGRTYSIVYHSTISKHCVPRKRWQWPRKSCGVTLEMTFGRLNLWSHSIIPRPHFLYKFNCERVCGFFVCLFFWLWLSFCLHWWIHCIAMNLSVATDDLVLILKNISSMAK